MRISTDGLILREQNIGEQNRLVTVLTRSHGVVRAFTLNPCVIHSGIEAKIFCTVPAPAYVIANTIGNLKKNPKITGYTIAQRSISFMFPTSAILSAL